MIDVITAKLGIAHDMLATQAAGMEQAAVAGKVRQRDGRLRVTIAGAVGVVFFKRGLGHVGVAQAGHGGQLGLWPLGFGDAGPALAIFQSASASLARVLGHGPQNGGALDEGQIGHAGLGLVPGGWWRPTQLALLRAG